MNLEQGEYRADNWPVFSEIFAMIMFDADLKWDFEVERREMIE